MATFTVTTASDVVNANDGVLSLREAVAQANATTAADTIRFSLAIENAGAGLVLAGGAVPELIVTNDLTIDGDRNDDGIEIGLTTTFDGRVLKATGAATDLVLRDLAIYSSGFVAGSALPGAADGGGAVLVQGGSLSVQDCSFAANISGSGSGYGGAIGASSARVTIAGSTFVNNGAGSLGGAVSLQGCQVTIEDSRFSGNGTYLFQPNGGGALFLSGSATTIARTSLTGNVAGAGGGAIYQYGGATTIADSTFAGNSANADITRGGAMDAAAGTVSILGSTITGNTAQGVAASGGGLSLRTSDVTIENSIVAGNRSVAPYGQANDVSGPVTASNGHNIFGSAVTGSIAGDLQNIAAGTLFAAVDPATGSGLVGANGTVALRNNAANPALAGADPLSANALDEVGAARPQPAGSLPDTGALERGQALSTTASARNDTLTGTGAANTINAQAGHDYVKGLGGADTLNGGDGGDLLDGGAGNDRLNGNAGVDLVTYASGTAAVTVDLSGTTDTARRGTETDTLTGIEGAIGSAGNDTFRGDAANNLFQGGLGKDSFTGGDGRDRYDFNAAAESGTDIPSRDVISDFVHGADRLDLMGIDANGAVAGNQAFRFLGTAALTGAGQVNFFTSNGSTFVQASTDADAAPEFQVQLTGLVALTAQDFYL